MADMSSKAITDIRRALVGSGFTAYMIEENESCDNWVVSLSRDTAEHLPKEWVARLSQLVKDAAKEDAALRPRGD